MMSVTHANVYGNISVSGTSPHSAPEPPSKVKRALTLLVVDTHSVEQHDVFVGHLSHHAGRFEESLGGGRKRTKGFALTTGWALRTRMAGLAEAASASHQGDVPVTRTQQLEHHFDLLAGDVTFVVVLLALHPQRTLVDVSSGASAEVLLLVHAGTKREDMR